LKAAEEGEHTYPCVVFDGSTVGASEINTLKGAKKETAGNPKTDDAHQFANQPFWPVRSSIYGLGEMAYEPAYVTTQELRSDGIIKQYVIDNDGVKIRGVLERVELVHGNDS
jgi:hypothetical protein